MSECPVSARERSGLRLTDARQLPTWSLLPKPQILYLRFVMMVLGLSARHLVQLTSQPVLLPLWRLVNVVCCSLLSVCLLFYLLKDPASTSRSSLSFLSLDRVLDLLCHEPARLLRNRAKAVADWLWLP